MHVSLHEFSQFLQDLWCTSDSLYQGLKTISHSYRFINTLGSRDDVLTCIPLRVFIIGMAFRNSGSHWSLFIAVINRTSRISLCCYRFTQNKRVFFLNDDKGNRRRHINRALLSVKSYGPTQLLLGLLEGLLKVGAGVGRGELEDEAALGGGRGELQLGGQEGHAEGQRLFVRQLPVHRRHQVLDHLVQGLREAQRERRRRSASRNISRFFTPDVRSRTPLALRYLMGEAEGFGQLADLTQGAQVLVQAVDHLLDALPVGRLGGTCARD